MKNDLLSKLKASGLLKKIDILEAKSHTNNNSLEDKFPGYWNASREGDVFVIEESSKYGSMHGRIRLSNSINIEKIFDLTGIPNTSKHNLEDILFLDIETSSLSFGAGSFVFLIGLCYFRKNGIQTKLLFIDSPSNERALLSMLENEIAHFSVLSSYNGKSFDVPFLRNRAAFHALSSEKYNKNHIDLLHLSRSLWKIRLDSCKLSEIEKEILFLKRDKSETPGWLVPQTYIDYLSMKNAELLKGVIYHNKIDVISLAALFQHICKLLGSSGKMKNNNFSDIYSLAKMYERKKDYFSAKLYYEIAINISGESNDLSVFYRDFGLLLKKIAQWERAVEVWKIAAGKNDWISCIELAKYYEHKAKDAHLALKLSKLALKIVKSDEKRLENTSHRIARLKRKIAKNEK